MHIPILLSWPQTRTSPQTGGRSRQDQGQMESNYLRTRPGRDYGAARSLSMSDYSLVANFSRFILISKTHQ